jgi:hypothetical protein
MTLPISTGTLKTRNASTTQEPKPNIHRPHHQLDHLPQQPAQVKIKIKFYFFKYQALFAVKKRMTFKLNLVPVFLQKKLNIDLRQELCIPALV